MKNSIFLKAITFVALSLVAFKGLSFETNVDSEVKGANLSITKDGSDGGDLTVEGQLSIGSVDTNSDGVVTTIDITSSNNDNKLPTVGAVKTLEVPAFCASKEFGDDITVTSTQVFIAETEKFDTNGDYDTATGKFTAPFAGIYQFTWTTLSNSEGRTALYVDDFIYLQTNYGVTGGHSLSTLVKLNANQIVHLAGAGQFDMKSYGQLNHNLFCGYLVQLTSG